MDLKYFFHYEMIFLKLLMFSLCVNYSMPVIPNLLKLEVTVLHATKTEEGEYFSLSMGWCFPHKKLSPFTV